MTLESLKAQAYDELIQVNMWTAKLRDTEQKIANFKPEVAPEVEDKKDGNI